MDAPTTASGRFHLVPIEYEDTMFKSCFAVITLAALSIASTTASAAADSPQPSTCMLAVRKVQSDIFSLPQGFLSAAAQREALIHLGAAARAAKDGDEGRCWNRFILSKYYFAW